MPGRLCVCTENYFTWHDNRTTGINSEPEKRKLWLKQYSYHSPQSCNRSYPSHYRVVVRYTTAQTWCNPVTGTLIFTADANSKHQTKVNPTPSASGMSRRVTSLSAMTGTSSPICNRQLAAYSLSTVKMVMEDRKVRRVNLYRGKCIP